MNEWLDMIGLESIWNDPDWPINNYRKIDRKEEKIVLDNSAFFIYNKLNKGE